MGKIATGFSVFHAKPCSRANLAVSGSYGAIQFGSSVALIRKVTVLVSTKPQALKNMKANEP